MKKTIGRRLDTKSILNHYYNVSLYDNSSSLQCPGANDPLKLECPCGIVHSSRASLFLSNTHTQSYKCLLITLCLRSVKVHSSSNSLNQQHQSAAKDLTSSPSPSSASTIQVTYLPSSGQRSKRPKHFLELKNFKDNYNTLESTL